MGDVSDGATQITLGISDSIGFSVLNHKDFLFSVLQKLCRVFDTTRKTIVTYTKHKFVRAC